MKLLAVLALASLAACAAPTHESAPPKHAALFDFHVGFWTNLHQRLYAETSRGAPLAAEWEADPAWQEALAAYRAAIPRREFMTLLMDERLVATARALSAAEDAAHLSADVDPALAAVLERAAVPYREHGWALDEQQDRAWIRELEPRLAQHGAALAGELERVFRGHFSPPMRVDVASFAGPVGAYTVLEPTHITISSTDAALHGLAALEMIFHEASHSLSGPNEFAAIAEKEPMLWHANLFYVVGEVVRRKVDPAYVAYADVNGLWDRAPGWSRYRGALAAAWSPYFDGKCDRDEVTRALLDALK
ncbi:MAG TPA: hypothetical protein VM509_13935 [Planctomycetota bacterium]|nr:hypothetical protein [Planctomycetota bacterium]